MCINQSIYDIDRGGLVHEVVPVRLTEDCKSKHIHLLLLTEEVKEKKTVTDIYPEKLTSNVKVKTHYCYIKNLAKPVRAQCTKSKNKIWICDRCLHYFYSELKLNDHQIYCIMQNKCRITMPQRDGSEFIEFRNYQRTMEVPFIIHADIESLLHSIENSHNNTDVNGEPGGAIKNM